jgi:hypothetical protein
MRPDAPWAWSGVADQVGVINVHGKVAPQIYQSVSVHHRMRHVQLACNDGMRQNRSVLDHGTLAHPAVAFHVAESGDNG